MEYSSTERRGWFQWHRENGYNVAATCRQFGISRSTFYRWVGRYDPTRPSRPLNSRSRRPHTTRQRTWTEQDLVRISEFDVYYWYLGRRPVREALNLPYSEATVGRMLQRVRRRCPVCGGKDSEHDMFQHTGNSDIKKAGVDFAALEEERQETATLQRQAEKLRQVRRDDPEAVSVVLQAEKLIKEGR